MGGTTLAKDDRGPDTPPGGTRRATDGSAASRGTSAPGGEGAGPAAPPLSGPAAPRSAPGPGRVRSVLAGTGLALGLLLAALQQLAPAAALPAIAADLPGHAGHPGHTSWAVTAYLLTATASLPLHGKLGDLHGRKGMVLLALALFTAGTALCGWARTLDELVAFRAVQGLGAGGLLTGVQALAAETTPARSRTRLTGLLAAVFATGSVAGLLLGGHLAAPASWRWGFHLTVPCALTALVLLAAALRTRPAAGQSARRARPDILGALLLTTATSCAVLLLAWGGSQHDWSSRTVLGLACGAVGTGLLYLVAAYWAPEPVMPLRLLRDPALLVSGLVAAAFGAALFGTAAFLPAFLQHAAGPGTGALRTGLLLLPFLASLAAGCLIAGHLLARTGRPSAYAVTGGAVALVAMWLLTQLRPDTPRLDHSVWQALLGIGIGLVLPALSVTVQHAAPAADLGAATGAHVLFRQLGACAGATLLGTLVTGRHDRPGALGEGAAAYTRVYAEAAPRALLHLLPVLAAGLLLAFFLKDRPPVPGPRAEEGAVPPARTPRPVPPPARPPPSAPRRSRAPPPEPCRGQAACRLPQRPPPSAAPSRSRPPRCRDLPGTRRGGPHRRARSRPGGGRARRGGAPHRTRAATRARAGGRAAGRGRDRSPGGGDRGARSRPGGRARAGGHGGDRDRPAPARRDAHAGEGTGAAGAEAPGPTYPSPPAAEPGPARRHPLAVEADPDFVPLSPLAVEADPDSVPLHPLAVEADPVPLNPQAAGPGSVPLRSAAGPDTVPQHRFPAGAEAAHRSASGAGGASSPAPPPPSAAGTAPVPGRGHRGGAPLRGTVRHHDGSGVPGAALTLVDAGGGQAAVRRAAPTGTTRSLRPPPVRTS